MAEHVLMPLRSVVYMDNPAHVADCTCGWSSFAPWTTREHANREALNHLVDVGRAVRVTSAMTGKRRVILCMTPGAPVHG